jgi:hypothetical protein
VGVTEKSETKRQQADEWDIWIEARIGNIDDLKRAQRKQIYSDLRNELDDHYKKHPTTLGKTARAKQLLDSKLEAIEQAHRKNQGIHAQVFGWFGDKLDEITPLALSLGGVISAATDILKPLAQFTQIAAVGSGAAALMLGVIARQGHGPRNKMASGGAALFAVICVGCVGFWGAQAFVTDGKEIGAIAATVPGIEGFQNTLVATLGRIDRKLDGLKKETSNDPQKELANLGFTSREAAWQAAFRDADTRLLNLVIDTGFRLEAHPGFVSRPYLLSLAKSGRSLSKKDFVIALRRLKPEIYPELCASTDYQAIDLMTKAIERLGKEEYRFYCGRTQPFDNMLKSLGAFWEGQCRRRKRKDDQIDCNFSAFDSVLAKKKREDDWKSDLEFFLNYRTAILAAKKTIAQ